MDGVGDVSEASPATGKVDGKVDGKIQAGDRSSFRTLLEAIGALNRAESTDELARRAVEIARDELGFSRVGLWFKDGGGDRVTGSYRVDEQGGLRDERQRKLDVSPDSPMGRLLSGKLRSHVERDVPLRDDNGKPVGRGDHALASMWDGHDVIGVLVCDDLLNPRPFDDERLEVLTMFATHVGHAQSRLAAIARLRESEQRLEHAIHGTALGVWDWDMQTDQVVYSDEWARMLGYQAEDLEPGFETWRKLVHPDDLEPAVAALMAHLDGRVETYEEEIRMRTASGEWKWILTKGLVVERNEQTGEPTRAVGTHRDIDQLKRTTEALRESEQRLEMALRGGGMGVWDLDVTSGIGRVDETWLGMLGMTADELDPRFVNWNQLVHPDDERGVVEAWLAMLDGTRPNYDVELRMRTSGGAWRWVHSCGAVFGRAGDGSPLRVIGIQHDIDTAKRATLGLKESEKRARASAERQGHLLNELDHRVRNNLSSLLSLVSLYSDGERDVDRFAESIAGKLMAMKKVHELIVDGRAMPIELPEMFAELGELFDLSKRKNVHCCENGARVSVPAHQAGPVAVVLHEMLLNSSKHGALAVDGSLDLNLTKLRETDTTLRVRIDWREVGRTDRRPAESSGRGLTLIEGLTRFDLRGSAAFEHTPEGFNASLEFEFDKPAAGEAYSI